MAAGAWRGNGFRWGKGYLPLPWQRVAAAEQRPFPASASPATTLLSVRFLSACCPSGAWALAVRAARCAADELLRAARRKPRRLIKGMATPGVFYAYFLRTAAASRLFHLAAPTKGGRSGRP